MSGWWKKPLALVAFGRKARVDTYSTIADLLASEFSLERALSVSIQAARDQNNATAAMVLRRWRQALVRGAFAAEVATWVPPAEGMMFAAYGRVDARHLFVGAARVADLRDRQISAVGAALTWPVVLAGGLIAMLWGAGAELMPVMTELLPAHQWPFFADLLRRVSMWLYANSVLFLCALGAIVATVAALTLTWTGPARPLFDRIPPFSLYRTVVGAAFLFVLLEYLRAGLDLNDRTFEELKRTGSRYTRHRITTLQRAMSRGSGLGAAMLASGHGFPDPSLAPVVAALDGVPQWENKLAQFVDRWVGRSEAVMKARVLLLNMLLTAVVTLVTLVALTSLFDIMEIAGRTAGRRNF